ncbi:unnamed protein product [Danaus chrysippus]|uniref:(African queen) hypothetical protein n=1 Tax=Danaus chrysippus TaxID=151541 RepID=A0A8J2QC30_9NEOP|nr:unnamed protein product [Danaus chrysippus]
MCERCLVHNAVHSSGSAPASSPPAAAGCYANDSFVGLNLLLEPTLDLLCRPSGLWDLGIIYYCYYTEAWYSSQNIMTKQMNIAGATSLYG